MAKLTYTGAEVQALLDKVNENAGLSGVRYDEEKKAFIFSANIVAEGGVASFANLEGFDPPTIMEAIRCDEQTITKKDGVLVAIGSTGNGGSSGDGDITDEDVVFCVLDEDDEGSTGEGGGISDEALQEALKDYVKKDDLPTTLPNPKALSWSGYSSGSYNGSAAATITIPTVPTELPNPKALKWAGGKFSESSTSPYYGNTQKTIYIPTSVSHLTGGTLEGDLTVDGDLQADHVTSLSTSDERLKENIREFSALEVLQSMGGVKRYEYTEEEVKRNPANAGTHLGFIYQNVEKSHMADKMCCKRVDGYGALNYLSSDYQALLAAVILEQADRIKRLEEMLNNRNA